MRNTWFTVLFFLAIYGCDDEIYYDLEKPKAGKQKVLIEEISGVRCPNCPDGSRLLEALNEDYDTSLIVVTYHAGIFSNPYKESKYDFKTSQTVGLMEMLGRPEGYPSAVIQRIPLSDLKTFQRLPNTWAAAISTAVRVDPVVDLKLAVDTGNTAIELKISALFVKTVNKPVYMTAYLVESGLVDPQADTQSKDEYVLNYEHNHVLREILTPLNGTKWSDGFQPLDFKEDAIHIKLQSLSHIIDPAKTSFIVFLHTEDGVLQVEKIKAIPL
jgi:hypothetical protein